MLNEWLEKVKNCGFDADIMFTQDGDRTIVLQWTTKKGFHEMKVFRGIDADDVLTAALQFVENYDAFINTAAGCGVKH